MLDKKWLSHYLKDLQTVDPQYVLPEDLQKNISTIIDKLNDLDLVVFIQPNDPWMMVNDSLIRLPDPPIGEGLAMEVVAMPVVYALGGVLVKDNLTGQVKPYRKSYKLKESQSYANNSSSLTMPLSQILVSLKMGVVLSDNGSVFITDRKTLSQIDPPNLDDEFKIILQPFSDEHLFDENIITDEFGYQRQKYSQNLAIKSLALSKSSYNMRIKQFIMDGWLDYTLIYEGEIKSTESDWVTKPTAGKQFITTIKQLISTQSTKAVVMGRPTSDGKAIINITFTGTKHVTDWLNNFKVGISHKLHRGFLELATVFDELVPNIKLTKLAKSLGIEDLTLMDAFKEGTKPNSRFKFWITGHSQGGSLTQVYIAEFMLKRNIRPENIWGYSFASPTVATSIYSDTPGNFPIYNIINTDDLSVRVGSMVRLGLDIVYVPDENFRTLNYKNYTDPKEHGMYQDILKLCYWLTDSFVFGEFMSALATFATEFPIANKYISEKMMQLLEKPYSDAKGRAPDPKNVERIREYLKVLYEKWGEDCLSKYMIATHQIPMNYTQIVLMDESNLKKCIFSTDIPAKLLTKSGENIMQPKDFPKI